MKARLALSESETGVVCKGGYNQGQKGLGQILQNILLNSNLV